MIGRGDKRQHEALIDEMVALQPRLRRFALGLCQSMDDADDVVQCAFERALGRLAQYRPGTRLDSWMFRIVHTVFLNERARVAVRDRYASDADPDLQPANGSPGLEASATLDKVYGVLSEMPEAQRAALLLVAVEGMSYAEAAAALGVPVGTLTSRLSRARAAIAAGLETRPAGGQIGVVQ